MTDLLTIGGDTGVVQVLEVDTDQGTISFGLSSDSPVDVLEVTILGDELDVVTPTSPDLVEVETENPAALTVEEITGRDGTNGADGAPGVVQEIIAGTNVEVDNTDPAFPIVSATGGGGGGGSAQRNFAIASTTWTFVHNLGYTPAVMLQAQDGTQIIGNVIVNTDTSTVVEFYLAVAGKMTLS